MSKVNEGFYSEILLVMLCVIYPNDRCDIFTTRKKVNCKRKVVKYQERVWRRREKRREWSGKGKGQKWKGKTRGGT